MRSLPCSLPVSLARVLAVVLVAAAAGTASAQTAQDSRNATAPNEAPQGPSITERAKSAGKRVAEGTRNLADKGKRKVQEARRDDGPRTTARTDRRERADGADRSMGNRGAATSTDTTRQQRMDEAYGNWQRQGNTAR